MKQTVSLEQAAKKATLLHCPIRGPLNVSSLAKDGLTPTEEAQRIDFIQFLLDREYPPTHIAVETIIIKNLGQAAQNSLRCDVIVYSTAVGQLINIPMKDRLSKAVLVAEIKRDSTKSESAWQHQLEPAMRLLPDMRVQGVYWDAINRLLFSKFIKDGKLTIYQDTLASLPLWGKSYKRKLLVYSDLQSSTNLVALLFSIANVMRSNGVNDEQVRYKETVKLILAKYCDERASKNSPLKPLALQVQPEDDHDFLTRVDACYKVAAKRYSKAKTLFEGGSTTELNERTLRSIVRRIQGTKFDSASNETMQQVFMSFVPAVFKKSLDQYFTPIELIKAMVHIADIGPNDKIADPGMGTADFLTAACEVRLKAGDTDIMQRIYGIDSDRRAYDLAIVNMILNKDGQSNLSCYDSIERHADHKAEMGVVLCNPPFGEKSIENRPIVLKHYDLGHEWDYNELSRQWVKSDRVLGSQQLGILFIEKSLKMLEDGGRLAIVLPEGYLSTPSHGYVREWLMQNARLLCLVELPRRIFVKSNADLRSNFVVMQKKTKIELRKLVKQDYPIFADMVRKVGFKMGKGFSALHVKDAETGIELRDESNQLIIDTDFTRIVSSFNQFKDVQKAKWTGARISSIIEHPTLDMKPRRLMTSALDNVAKIKAGPYKALSSIADVVTDTIDLTAENYKSLRWRMVAGLDIRAVEGMVTPSSPRRAWQIVEQKTKRVFRLLHNDIVVGLVRPERRNIGLLLDAGNDIVATPDGIAIVRIKAALLSKYPQEWLFATLRSEMCRLQFWTEAGGTSYGKLSAGHINNALIPIGKLAERLATANEVRRWGEAVRDGAQKWSAVGTAADRHPIVNSSGFGLLGSDHTIEEGDDED